MSEEPVHVTTSDLDDFLTDFLHDGGLSGFDQTYINQLKFNWCINVYEKSERLYVKDYAHFLNLANVCPVAFEGLNTERMWKEIFPPHFSRSEEQIKAFLIFAAKYGSSYITYFEYVRYCRILIRLASQGCIPVTNGDHKLLMKVFQFDIIEVANKAAVQYGLRDELWKDMKTLGLGEVRQLMLADLRIKENASLSEVHHLLWCMVHILDVPVRACVPRTPLTVNSPVLKWKHIKFIRGKTGILNAVLDLREMFTTCAKRSVAKIPPVQEVRSPKLEQNMHFSIPHRLLALAIRRGLIQDAESIDDLLEDSTREIMIKQENLEDNILEIPSKILDDRSCSTYFTRQAGRLQVTGARVASIQPERVHPPANGDDPEIRLTDRDMDDTKVISENPEALRNIEKAFLNHILEAYTMDEPRLTRHVICPLCVDEFQSTKLVDMTAWTMDLAILKLQERESRFEGQPKFRTHMLSDFHSIKARWCRWYASEWWPRDALCIFGYCCPYCVAANIPNYPWMDINSLIQHIEESTAEECGFIHDELKRQAGWYGRWWSFH